MKLHKTAALLAVSFICLLSAGCNRPEQVGKTTSGEAEYDRICIDGVEYLQRLRGNRGLLAVHFKPDGTVYTCGR